MKLIHILKTIFQSEHWFTDAAGSSVIYIISWLYQHKWHLTTRPYAALGLLLQLCYSMSRISTKYTLTFDKRATNITRTLYLKNVQTSMQHD